MALALLRSCSKCRLTETDVCVQPDQRLAAAFPASGPLPWLFPLLPPLARLHCLWWNVYTLCVWGVAFKNRFVRFYSIYIISDLFIDLIQKLWLIFITFDLTWKTLPSYFKWLFDTFSQTWVLKTIKCLFGSQTPLQWCSIVFLSCVCAFTGETGAHLNPAHMFPWVWFLSLFPRDGHRVLKRRGCASLDEHNYAEESASANLTTMSSFLTTMSQHTSVIKLTKKRVVNSKASK